MSEASQARAAALAIELKKDSLAQLQNGDWKLTVKVAAQDMPAALLEALPGTRYQTAFVEVDDVEQPISRKPEPTAGEKAKRHFEVVMHDDDFKAWFRQNCRSSDVVGIRELVKLHLGMTSANELLENPEPWNALYNEFAYRNHAR